MKKQWLFGAGMMLVSIHAIAQQGNPMDSIIIRENRIQAPYGRQNRNIQVLDSKQIAALPVKSTNELLSYVAGVDLRQRGPNGTQADISIDGSTFDQVLILVNGVKMSDPQTGHHTLNLPIPLTSIDHIEVLRGPAAQVYGVNALTGAVNIVTHIPEQNTVSAQVYAGSSFKTDSATGDSYYGWGAQATASIAGKNQGHLLSVSHDEGTGYRYNTAYNAYRLYYQNQIKLNDKNKLEAMGGYIRNDFGGNGYYSAPADANSTEKVETALGSIAYTFTPNDKVMIRPRVSYRYNNDDYIFIKQKPEVYHNMHETYVMTGEVQSTIKVGKGIIGAGVEYRNDRINSYRLGARDRSNLGVYAEYKHYFNEKLNAGAGVYGNYNTDYDFQLFPGVDVGYRFMPKWKAFANATMGQRLPTYTDLYYIGPTNVGNASLKPEHAKYAEGGLQYNTRYLWAQASYFYRNTSDFIDWVRASSTAPWQPQNYQQVNGQGATLTAAYKLSEHIGLSDAHNIVLNANYTYLSPAIDAPANDISKYAIEALRHQATASVRTTWWGKLQVNANMRYLYRINANDYTLLDARVGYTLKQWNVYADVNNILDTQYKEIGTVPMPGRWFTLGVRFNTTW
ncbi:MAG TPA: TonB-dependent receptor [Flavipsychrobacter sp.]